MWTEGRSWLAGIAVGMVGTYVENKIERRAEKSRGSGRRKE
jgi:hypothetical protein